nr:hypothetical protein [uncultured Limnohabitans sp.]
MNKSFKPHACWLGGMCLKNKQLFLSRSGSPVALSSAGFAAILVASHALLSPCFSGWMPCPLTADR